MFRSIPYVCLLCLLLVLGQSTAFTTPKTVEQFRPGTIFANNRQVATNSNLRDLSLNAYKKRAPVTKSEQKDATEKASPLAIFFTYLTPWRNPNSIFLYMFLAVYILGTISEARHNAPM